MISLKHPFCNAALTPPIDMTEDECRTLHIYRELPTEEQPYHAVTSFWTPEPAELETLNSGGSVMLRILGHTHPPLSMRVSPPNEDAVPAGNYVPFVMTTDEFHSLCEEVVKLREDKARLDWLAAHPSQGEVHGGADDGGTFQAWAVSTHAGTNLRDTLDIIIAADPQG